MRRPLSSPEVVAAALFRAQRMAPAILLHAREERVPCGCCQAEEATEDRKLSVMKMPYKDDGSWRLESDDGDDDVTIERSSCNEE